MESLGCGNGTERGRSILPSLERAKNVNFLAIGDWKSTPLSGLIDLKSWPCLPVPDFGDRIQLSWLVWAVLYNRLELVKQLLKFHAAEADWGISPTYRNNAGGMALLCAIIAGSFDMIKVLIEGGVSTVIYWESRDSAKQVNLPDLVVHCQPRHLQRKIVDLIVCEESEDDARTILTLASKYNSD
jgi:ankyrin repeat protein